MSWLEVIRSFSLALATSVLLYLFGVSTPLAGVLLIPLAPQPALAFGLKWGKGKGMALLVLATALVFYFGGRELAVGYSLLALMVIFLFVSFGRRWSVEWVVAGVAAGMIAALSGGLIYLFGSWSHIQDALREALRQNMEITLGVYDKISLSAESVEILQQRAPQIIEVLLRIMPALAFAGFVTLILINLFFLLRRFPVQLSFFASAGDLREWRAPEPLIWCFILSGFALFLPGWETVSTAALNLLLMIVVFYFFQGLSIIAYYFHHKHVPYFLRSLAYVLIVFEQIFTLLVVGLGLFDLWGDFRRLKKKDLSPGQAS